MGARSCTSRSRRIHNSIKPTQKSGTRRSDECVCLKRAEVSIMWRGVCYFIDRDGWLDKLSTRKIIANKGRLGWQQPLVKLVLVLCHHSITIAALYISRMCQKKSALKEKGVCFVLALSNDLLLAYVSESYSGYRLEMVRSMCSIITKAQHPSPSADTAMRGCVVDVTPQLFGS